MLDVNVLSEHVNVGGGIRATGDDMSIDRQPQQRQQQQQAVTFLWILGVKMLDAVLDGCTPAICTATERRLVEQD